MKRRFLVRIILFVVFALIIGVALMSDEADTLSWQDETITDNYYNNFFGLADGIAEMKGIIKRKFDQFINFVEMQ